MYTWAFAEVGFLEFVNLFAKLVRWLWPQVFSAHHFCQSSRSYYVSCMDETIEMPGRLLNRLPHIIFAVQIEDVCDEV